jgi:hypothetical protein
MMACALLRTTLYQSFPFCCNLWVNAQYFVSVEAGYTSIGVEQMKLTAVEIDHFKHVLNSGEVRIEPDITCLVGQNESGKSTF